MKVVYTYLIHMQQDTFSYYKDQNAIQLTLFCVPLHVTRNTHHMAHLQLTDGDNGLQIWRMIAHIMNKQSQRVNKEGPSYMSKQLRIFLVHKRIISAVKMVEFVSGRIKKTKLHGQSPRANYTDRATAACRRS
jgi:hypothetical protein